MGSAAIPAPTPGAGGKSCPSCGGQGDTSCPNCGKSGDAVPAMPSSSFVYALGRVEHRFPRISVEMEIAQVAKGGNTQGQTDSQVLRNLLLEPSNRYLARQLCWVFTVKDQPTFILHPRDPRDYDLLVEALRPVPRPTDLDAVIGIRGRVAPSDMCNGLTIPIVTFDQLYPFDRKSLVSALVPPEKMSAEQFEPSAEHTLNHILQMTDNTGTRNEHRALNYLAVRCPTIYTITARALEQNSSLSDVRVLPSGLSDARNILNVIFSYKNRNTGVVEKHFLRVDVTDEFPFLVTPMSPYYDLNG
jgi:hypothetical protein